MADKTNRMYLVVGEERLHIGWASNPNEEGVRTTDIFPQYSNFPLEHVEFEASDEAAEPAGDVVEDAAPETPAEPEVVTEASSDDSSSGFRRRS